MSSIIVITGASSGFGALTARALADAADVSPERPLRCGRRITVP
jgi:NADP-dependent 3-hydroxy acid dehydrogenase YdfG